MMNISQQLIQVEILNVMGNDFCDSCNTLPSQPQFDKETMYRTGTTNSTYGSHIRGYSVNPRASSIVNHKPVGLYNLTNTCYISAILQILFLIVPESINKSKGKITQLFFKLKSTKDTRDYKIFKMQVQKLIEIVTGYEQQDAQEFLIYFLELLDRQSTNLYSKTIPNLDYNERFDIAQNYKTFISQMKKIQSGPIIDLFSSELIREFRCEKKHFKHKFERYQCLSLSFPTPTTSSPFSYSSSHSQISLKDLLQKQFDGQLVTDLMCEQCKRKTNFEKKTYLYTLPNYLILHLSRFKQGYYSNQKINTIVQFDQQISIRQYCDNNSARYRLIGTVNHFGTLNRGHYYAEVKYTDGKWYEINDEVVREANVEKYSNKSKYVYILFYQKQK